MKDYEGLFITRANLTDDANQKLLAVIEGELSKSGGKVENVEKWGRKNLAYPISRNKEGIYYKLDFKIAPAKISELKKSYRLHEDILKVMIVKKR